MGHVCEWCQSEIGWVFEMPVHEVAQALAHGGDRWQQRDLKPSAIEEPSRKPVRVDRPLVRFGRGLDQHEVIFSSDVEIAHAVVVRRERKPDAAEWEHWVFDCCSRTGTFVNGQPVAAHRLESGDLLQIGPWAWDFNAEHQQLEPVGPISGVEVCFEDVAVDGRLAPISRVIRPGEFIAITGPSGAGKSTLLHVLMDDGHTRNQGRVLVSGRDIGEHGPWYRRLLGYVSQEEAVHLELMPLQALQYSAALRSAIPQDDDELKALLWRVDLSSNRWGNAVKDLSGGEARRVRVATELVAAPRLLILDEPASGLDRTREMALMRLLRSLARRGCTVILVTHGIGHLNYADRVWILNKGQLCFDGDPEELRQHAPENDLSRVDFSTLNVPIPVDGPVPSDPPTPVNQGDVLLHEPSRRFAEQTLTLFRREVRRAVNRWPTRLGVPLLVMPSLFGIAIGLAVSHTRMELLSFLSVLATIWMGSSLTVMTIVDERHVYNHERLLFLRIPRYILAKFLFFGVLAAMQTLVFLLVLWGVRVWAYNSEAMLHGVGWVAAVLLLVSWTSVAMGLVISALSNESKQLAAALLPLVMMCQILFSVQVAGKGDAYLEEAYGELTFRDCEGSPDCKYRPTRWLPEHGQVCDECRRWIRQQEAARKGEAELSGQTLQRNTSEDLPTEVWQENRNRPNPIAAFASYATIARFGDILLRSFANSAADYEAFSPPTSNDDEAAASSASTRLTSHQDYGYRRWRWEAIGWLMGQLLLLLAATMAVLKVQPRWFPAWRRLKAYFSAFVRRRTSAPVAVRIGSRRHMC